jgi:hypothetical protein
MLMVMANLPVESGEYVATQTRRAILQNALSSAKSRMRMTTENACYHIVFLKRAVLLVRREGDWRALQAEFLDFRSSLGPWTLGEAAAWVAAEYGTDTGRDADIAAVAGSAESVVSL